MPTASNPWEGFLWDNRNALWGAVRPKTGGQNFIDYYMGQGRNRAENSYMGALGGMALAGQEPALNELDYFRNYPFLREFMKLSPGQRGERQTGGIKWNIPQY